MYAVLKSFGLKGLNGFPVEVEADISGGMPALSIVGLPDSAVRESGDRVHAALKNLGFKWPDRRITINLAPAACPASCRPGPGKKPWRRRKVIPSPGRCPPAGAS